LKKRKTNLKSFLNSSGIVAYSTLVQKCEKMGVSPPSEEDFKNLVGDAVSSPQEGVVVLDSPLLVNDKGDKINVDSFAEPEHASSDKQKKSSKKIAIDESVFVTKVATNAFEKSDANLGDADVQEDSLDSSVTKLSTLKKNK
jgi:hypothetical protein